MNMSLLDIYEQMEKDAEAKEIETQRRDMLTKYASVAEEMLEEEHGEDYTAEDVEKLAEALIVLDIEATEKQEKVAEYEEFGRSMARAFLDELKQEEE